MPIIFLRYKKKPWLVKFREPWSGRPRQRAFTEEADAQAFYTAQESIYERERAIIKAVRRKHSQSRPTSPTVAELLRRYLESLDNPTTRAARAYHLRLFADIFGARKAHCLTVEDVAAFLDLQAKRGVSKSTAYRRMGIVRAAFRWAARWGLLPVNPLASLRLPTQAPQTPDPPTAREARLLYAAAAPHVRRVIALGMATGARIGPSELFRLRWTDVDLKGAVLRMPNASKGAALEAREVPLRPDILTLLRRWAAEDAAQGYTLVIHYKGQPVRSISRGWRNALRRAGITRRIRPYDLRHAFASRALDYGAELKCIAEIMGHSDEKMIVRFYRHTSAKARRKAVNAAPSLGLERVGCGHQP